MSASRSPCSVQVSNCGTSAAQSKINDSFYTVRIAAFVIRAVMAGESSAGQNLRLMIAEQVLFSVGYFGLLYSAYTLVLDR